MANKMAWLLGIWGIIVVTYIILTASMPTIVSIAETTNTTLVATSNMSNYPGLQEAVESSPFWIYVIPALVGGIATVIVLKAK